MASVKVAVRVRPFNQREINMNSVPIIEMDGKKTRICNQKVVASKQEGDISREKYKDFTFDYSYWSFDDKDSHFATQEQVFKDLGTDVVENVFTGYNYCVFAYGQTGSGKTHTMMGSQTSMEGPGLIPRICQNMFSRMSEGKQTGTTYRVEVSYLEIYNERVKDLLKKNSANSHSLKVREHPKYGPYVEELSKHLVMDYQDILNVMNRGNVCRTTASTNMNDVSSRSHAIFTMTFSQAGFVEGMPSETVSKVHLVDLAGSERADASGATGQRLKEGAHINKSLVTLGSVISALAEMSENKNTHKHSFIPYRDSTLTWLLKDSLGGNAKTIMIATLSPADCNYGETLSTLRYANRAKNIINKPTINEDTNVKLIKELRAEINKLKHLLGNNVDNQGTSPEVLAELHKKEAKEKSLTEEWTEKWKETQKILMEQKDLALRKTGAGVVLDSQKPHLIRIDDDLTSTGITLYHLKEGETTIGSEEGSDIVLLGLETRHCSITLEGGSSTLVPFGGATCRINSQLISCPTKLSQGCAIRLGETSMFRYNDPVEAAKLRKEGNLSRNSFMSRSASDLAWSAEFNSTIVEEETNQLEEKRKQLESEESRLQKESQALLEEKAQLELQRSTYQLRQQETEEAWKAEQINRITELTKAQATLEQNRHKFEQEYTAHRRRLAEDYKRLEQDEQETLATLHLKEADLKKRREYLDWEFEQEMEQMEIESAKIEKLKVNLHQKSNDVEKQMETFNNQLKMKLDKPDEDFKTVLQTPEADLTKYIDEQVKLIDEWKDHSTTSLKKQKEDLANELKIISEKIRQSTDPNTSEQLNAESENIKMQLETVSNDFMKLDEIYQSKRESLNVLPEFRNILSTQKQECCDINNEIDSSIKSLHAHEKKITKIEADLTLIADQEKLIVGQLAHIMNSKQKLLTIIENATDGFVSDVLNDNSIETSTRSHGEEALATPKFRSRESSPNTKSKRDISQLKINDLSPIKMPHEESDQLAVLNSSLANTDGANADNISNLQLLVEQITAQKTIVLECLENDCDKEELNTHLKVLQDLRSRYLELGNGMDINLRDRWLSLDEDDSTFEFDKTGDGTSFGESDMDDSELHSIMDQDEQLQIIVEERVERRLREILGQLKSGEKPNLLRHYGISRHILQRSLPCDLNDAGAGSTTEDEGSGDSLHNRIPRSHSLSSGNWSTMNSLKNGVLPGILDVRISSYCERGAGLDTHIKYEVSIVTPFEKWVILRRYKQFRDLWKTMSKKYGSKVAKLSFPPKVYFGNAQSRAKERKVALEVFLQNLIKVCSSLPTCPLHNTNSNKIKESLLSFSLFFEKGVFETTKYGTS